MDEVKAHALSWAALLATPLCRCMRGDCPHLHYADLSAEQRARLEHDWEHGTHMPGCPLCAQALAAETRWWTLGAVFGMCVEYPGLRALLVFAQSSAYARTFAEVRRLLVLDIGVEVHGRVYREVAVQGAERGHVLRFPNGSVLRMLALDGAKAHRALNGEVFQLAVFDGLDRQDQAYVASRVRAEREGVPVLGMHQLAVDGWGRRPAVLRNRGMGPTHE